MVSVRWRPVDRPAETLLARTLWSIGISHHEELATERPTVHSLGEAKQGAPGELARRRGMRQPARRRDSLAYCAGDGPVRASSSTSRVGASAAPIRWTR